MKKSKHSHSHYYGQFRFNNCPREWDEAKGPGENSPVGHANGKMLNHTKKHTPLACLAYNIYS